MSSQDQSRRSVAVVGLGYVGLSLACLFARRHDVVGVEVNPQRVELIRAGHSPLRDEQIELQFETGPVPGVVSRLGEVERADLVVVCTPTNFDPQRGYFDTSGVDEVVGEALGRFPEASVVIKSTIPIGHVEGLRTRFETDRVLHSPEFLREGRALADNLKPSRILVGDKGARGVEFAGLLRELAENDPKVILTEPTAAEAAKLFANTYLAMRVAFFNELDSFAVDKGLSFSEMCQAISTDPRIGDGYNEPSFGYGGYCLPKDTKQLLANFQGVPQTLIAATVHANEVRKDFIVDRILTHNPHTVGVLGLAMKRDSDNFREAATRDIANRLASHGIEILIFEPAVDQDTFDGFEVVRGVEELNERADLIIFDRVRPEVELITKPTISRDPYLK